MSASAGLRVYALLGDPVEHSLSPAIHNAAFLALDLDATYVTLRVSAEELPATMRAIVRRSRGKGGGNVTLPHKERAARELDHPRETVMATVACNCFWGAEPDGLAGDNTDVAGFELACRERLDFEPEGSRVLLLGAGGAARAVLHALLRGGAERVEVLNRTVDRARGMVREVSGATGSSTSPARAEVLDGERAVRGSYDLVVNATSLGLRSSDPLPLELAGLPVGAVFDLVYGSGGTSWTRRARDLGVPAVDGTEMLVRQAGLSLERWTGRPPPLDVMREAARSAIDARAEGRARTR